MKIVFPLTECTFLRYFVPVIKAAIDRDHEVHVSAYPNNKYNNPMAQNNLQVWAPLLKGFGVKEGRVKDADVCVCIEGIKSELAPVSYSLTYMYDFAHLYKGYVDKVNHVVFPSEYVARAFGCVSDKNLYFGSPKYDTPLEWFKEWIRPKYGLNPSEKYALVMYPRRRDMNKIDISKVCEDLIQEGYTPILKTRGKDPILPEHSSYINYGDASWYPHTSMELIVIADKIINTGSSAIKEAVMLGKESLVTNYNIKPSSCVDLPELYEEGSREKYLDPGGDGNASMRIVKHMEKNYG